MKKFIIFLLIFYLFIIKIDNCSFLKKISNSNFDFENYTNNLTPGIDNINNLKKTIQSLILKLNKVDKAPHFKYC